MCIKGSGRGLTLDTVRAFAWKYWGEQRKIQSVYWMSQPRSQSSTPRLRIHGDCRAIFQNLTVAQLIKKSRSLYVIQSFTDMFIRPAANWPYPVEPVLNVTARSMKEQKNNQKGTSSDVKIARKVCTIGHTVSFNTHQRIYWNDQQSNLLSCLFKCNSH